VWSRFKRAPQGWKRCDAPAWRPIVHTIDPGRISHSKYHSRHPSSSYTNKNTLNTEFLRFEPVPPQTPTRSARIPPRLGSHPPLVNRFVFALLKYQNNTRSEYVEMLLVHPIPSSIWKVQRCPGEVLLRPQSHLFNAADWAGESKQLWGVVEQMRSENLASPTSPK